MGWPLVCGGIGPWAVVEAGGDVGGMERASVDWMAGARTIDE